MSKQEHVNTRTNILHAALDMFAERGYHGTTVPQVAERAGVATGSIYSHFLSKEELVNEAFRYSKRLLADLLVEGFDFDAPLREMFKNLWGRLTLFARDYPVHFSFLELQHHTPYLDEESKAVELQVIAPVWSFCVSARQQGLCKDMPEEIIMSLIWGAFVGLHKSERLGYCHLDQAAIDAAEQATWDLFALH